MKDSSVRPAVLFDPRRQKRLLEGLAVRFRTCLDQQQELRVQHAEERSKEETQLSQQRGLQTDRCRQQRRNMLEQWDAAEEQLTSRYETVAINNRKELNRLAARYRRKAADAKMTIDRKVEARKQAVLVH